MVAMAFWGSPVYAQSSVPEAPTGLTTPSVAHDSVALAWDDPGDDSISGYRILRRDAANQPPGTFSTVKQNTGSASTSYTDDTVSAQTRYVYRVQAINSQGTSARSGYVNVETPVAPVQTVPAEPTGLTAQTVSHDSVTLTWDERGDSSVTGYQVLRRSRDGDEYEDGEGAAEFVAVVDNTGSSATSYTDTSVTARTRYVYRVKAVSQHGTSGQSSYVRADTPAAPSIAKLPVGDGVGQVLPRAELANADLSALQVDGVSVAGFDAETTSYQFGVANLVTQVTVAGVAVDASATVAYSGTDADDVADGHQVDLSVGANVVTVTVTVTDDRTRDYTVSVNRGSDAPFGWKAEDDFDTLKAAGNIRARGIWSDGTTMWVGDDGPNKLFAYTLATRQRNSDEDFNALHEAVNRSIRGLWSDDTTMWVVDHNYSRIFAYAREGKQREEDSEFLNLDIDGPYWSWGLWSDGTTMWISDPVFERIYAYEIYPGAVVNKVRASDKDIAQGDGNVRSADLWSDGTTMWVADQYAKKLFAYALDSGQRDSVRDFDTLKAAGNTYPGGIWSDGTTMWVADGLAEKIHAYNMPGNPDLSALSLSAGTSTPTSTPTWSPSFHRLTTAYAVSVENSVSTITVTATAVDAANARVEFLDADDMTLADADDVAGGLQVNLLVGDMTIKVKVTADDGVVTRTYTLVVTREAPSTDLSALSVGGKSVAGFDAETTSYQFGVANLVTRVTVAGVAVDASATVAYSGTDADDVAGGHQVDLSVGANVVTVTVTATDSRTRDYTVSVNRGSDAPFGWKAEDDFDTLKAAGNEYGRGIWSDGTTMWVGDDGPNKLFAYTLATGQRNSDEDFNALHEAVNRSIRGLWSDGTTMWVGDYNDSRIFAYAREGKQRDEDSEFLNLQNDGPMWSWGLWSNGTTMWISDPVSDRIYAYEIYPYEVVNKVRASDKDIIPAQGDGNVRSADIWSDGTTMWVADETADKLFAYALDSGQRDSVRDFDDLAAGNTYPAGIWSDGTTMWVADRLAEKIYAYNMPGNPDLSALSLSAGTSTPTSTPTWSPSFHRLTTAYAVSVENSVSTITVTATAVDAANARVEFLDADDMTLADADDVAGGLQVNLLVGDMTIKVKVTADDGVVTRTYTLVVTREAPAPVSFGSSSYNVGEGESVTVTVSLNQALSGQVVVPLNVTDGSGVSSADYSGVPPSVTIASGATSATFSFSAGDDDLVEEDEVVTVTFGTLPGSVIEGSPATTTVTITNDDEPSWALSVNPELIAEADASSSTVSVSSGGVTFTSSKTIDLGFGGTATKSTDYTVAAETLTLAAGRSTVSTTVSALDDAVADASETILVTATLDDGTIGAPQLITVVDDEQVASEIVLEVSPSAVGEGAGATTLTVTGTLDGAALTTDTVVSLTLEAGTATAGADYTVGSAAATLRIAAMATSGTASFALTPVDDMIDDDDETVTIASSSISTLTLTPASLTVTITDNDEPNVAPVFEPLALTYSLEENSGADVAVGAAVTATDANGDTLSYSLGGTGAGSFRIDSASGQISTAPGAAYDYESATNRFALTVTANDPRGGNARATVMIDISDVDEPPPRPAAPSVSPTRGETDSLDVSWIAPSTSGRPGISGYELQYRTGGDPWASWSHTGTGIVATIDQLSPDTNYDVQVRAINDEGESRWSPSGDGSTFSTDDPCLALGPTPTMVAVPSVPIVVASTTDVYFVLYVTHELDGAEVLTPVAVVVGKAGTTTLGENVEALPAGRYRVEQYNVADPADIDGDCIDDLTELAVMGRMNPLNPAPAILRNDGAVAIPDSDTFEELSYTEPGDDYEYVKFALLDMDTDHPLLYFINSTTHLRHPIVLFLDAIGHTDPDLPWAILGEIVYDPDLVAADGTHGVYYFWFVRYDGRYTFKLLDRAHALLTAAMPLLGDIEGDKLSMYIPNHRLPGYQADLETLRDSRIPLLFNEDIYPDTDFLALNPEVGYGLLRVMEPGERPSPLNIVIYESLPNELPRVGGIITTVPQTPLSHVNLRAVQDSVPNAYIKDAIDKEEINALIARYVRYEVTADGYKLRAATKAEVDAHHAASRPARAQFPERDLSVTEITPLSDVGFDDWRAFGVKAANVAVLGTLGFPDGTVPNGFAIPFHFYNEFMNNAVLAAEKVFGKGTLGTEADRFTMPAGTKLIDAVKAILAHPRFQTDFEIQDEMLDDLREVIEEAESPLWMKEALTAMHAECTVLYGDECPVGRSLRYRSSTNNEDLPGFSGAGLYDSNTQKQKETENEGIDKSMKQVFASLWNFRAFTEREFHRIDHLATAMGVLVHPNYSDELANGVAASFDPVGGLNSYYYLNTQLGEDLVTNPEANSEPEEILLHQSGDYYEILATSNQVAPGTLLMSDAQMKQLAEHLTVIHEKFAGLYGSGSNRPFAIEIEFKITEADILAIKQARPWVFSDSNPPPPPDTVEPTITTRSNPSPYRENGTGAVYTFQARDPQGGAVSWSVTGTDSHAFDISSSGALTFGSPPDFENPIDSNRDNVYEIAVVVTDDQYLTDSVDVVITVTNHDEGVEPTISSRGPPSTYAENRTTTVYIFRASDPQRQAIAWTLEGADRGDFTLTRDGSGRGVLAFIDPPDFEAPGDSDGQNDYELTVVATDPDSHADRLSFTITVTDVNEGPEVIGGGDSFSVQENRNWQGAAFTGFDPEGGSVTRWALGGRDGGDFTITETGVMTFRSVPDYERPADSHRDNVYEVEVRPYDGRYYGSHHVTVTVEDVNEITGPAALNRAENSDVTLGRYLAVGRGDLTVEPSWSLSGTDGGDFTIDENGRLTFRSVPDYERPADSNRDNTYVFTVRATDDRYYGTLDVTVTVTPVNEPPTITTTSTSATTLRQPENRTSRLYTYRATDPEGANTVSWSVGGVDDRFFVIDERGRFSFSETSPPDYELPGDSGGDNVYNVVIQATDDDRNTAPLDVTITVTDVNEGPEVTSGGDSFSVQENRNWQGAAFTDFDPEGGSVTRWALGGRDGGDFTITETGVMTFRSVPDYERPADSHRDNVYEVEVRPYDGRYYGSHHVTVTVEDVNEITGPAALNRAENSDVTLGRYLAVGRGDLTVEPSWSLSGTDGGDFTIDENGRLTFRSVPDYERPADSNRDNTYGFTVRATDDRYYGTLDVTVTVTPVNEPPTITTTSTSATTLRQPENRTSRLYTYRATDPEGANTVSWSVGGVDGRFFVIDERGRFSFSETSPPDYELPGDSGGDNVYNVVIQATDDDRNTAPLDVTITVTDVNEGPEVIGGGNSFSVQENRDWQGAAFTGFDPEGGSVTRWALGGRDGGDFVISETGVMTFRSVPDYERPADSDRDNVYEVEVRPYDGRYYGSHHATVTVEDVPEITGPATHNIAENFEGTLGSYLAGGRGDLTVEPNWSLSGTDGGDFTIDENGQLTFRSVPDYERPSGLKPRQHLRVHGAGNG